MKQPWWERVRLGYWRLRWRLACAVQGRHYTNEHGYCSRCDRVVAKPKAILGTGDKVMGTVDQVTQTDDGIRITGTLTTSRREPQLRKGSVAGRGDVPKRAPAPSVIPPTSRRDVIALALKDWALGVGNRTVEAYDDDWTVTDAAFIDRAVSEWERVQEPSDAECNAAFEAYVTAPGTTRDVLSAVLRAARDVRTERRRSGSVEWSEPPMTAEGRERGWAREVYDPGTALDHHRGMESST